MNLLVEQLDQIASERQCNKQPYPALMTHVVLGYPTLKESLELVRVMVDGGARIIELQIPFSDPMADGPTIMHANEVALAGGVTPRDCLEAMEKLSRCLPVPLLFMSYFIFNSTKKLTISISNTCNLHLFYLRIRTLITITSTTIVSK